MAPHCILCCGYNNSFNINLLSILSARNCLWQFAWPAAMWKDGLLSHQMNNVIDDISFHLNAH